MTIEIGLTLVLLSGFGFLMYVSLSYFRWLRKFIDRLECEHSDVFKSLNEPGLALSRINIRSVYLLAVFTVRRDYAEQQDHELTRLGDAVRIRMLATVLTVLFLILSGPIAHLLIR